MGFETEASGNPEGRPRGARNKVTLAVAEWNAAILGDPEVQARLLSEARQGRLHHAVLGQLLLSADGRPRASPQSESMILQSALPEARESLRIKLDGIRHVIETAST